MGAELQGRSYYGKHDESSVIDFLQQEGSVEETANLNELLYRLEARFPRSSGPSRSCGAGRNALATNTEASTACS